MGKVFRLTCQLNLLLSYFGLSALYLQTPDPACRTGITPPPYVWKYVLIWSSCLYTVVESWFNSQRRRVAPPFTYLGTFFICLWPEWCVAVDLFLFAGSLAGYSYLYRRLEAAKDPVFSILRCSSSIVTATSAGGWKLPRIQCSAYSGTLVL